MLNGHFQLVPAFHKLALCALPAKALPTSLYTANDYDSQARVGPDRYGFALTIELPGHPPELNNLLLQVFSITTA